MGKQRKRGVRTGAVFGLVGGALAVLSAIGGWALEEPRAARTDPHVITPAQRAFWSFCPLRRPALPTVKNTAWVRSPIDRFILAKLEAKGLKPAPPADRRTLIRRATFDLIGLPPTPEEVEAFVRDRSPNAFATVVDRLLASPHYGERWGRHWLDLVRYADSNGLDENIAFANAFRYRDYVVAALNKDKPYDRFLTEQLAGDLMPAPNDATRNEQITATGFLCLGAKVLAEPDKPKLVMDIVDEQIEVTSKAFLGLTVACARCHDHKFDPIPTSDYYALAGIFKSTRTMTDLGGVARVYQRPLVLPERAAQIAEHSKKIQALESALKTATEQANQELTEAIRKDVGRYLLAAWELAQSSDTAPSAPSDTPGKPGDPKRPLPDAAAPAPGPATPPARPAEAIAGQRGLYASVLKKVATALRDLKDNQIVQAWRGAADLPEPEFAALADKLAQRFANSADREFEPIRLALNGKTAALALPERPDLYYTPIAGERVKKAAEALKLAQAQIPLAFLTLAVEDGKIENARIHLRGSTLELGDEVPRHFLTVLSNVLSNKDNVLIGKDNVLSNREPEIGSAHSGRLELAQWLTRPDHPLTSRVEVNRIWQGHFGAGIVRTPDNWGLLGERPTHPELLDWLALTFIEQGWSLKKMHRLLMLSSTYQMSSADSPKAEEVDPENRLLWHANRRRLEAEPFRDALLAVSGMLDRTIGGSLLATRDNDYVTNDQSANMTQYDVPRRSLYLPVIRNALFDMFQAFDVGDPSMVNAKRATTTIPAQALFVMNSPFVLQQAGAFAAALLSPPNRTDAERIRSAYLRAFSRPPAPDEDACAIAFLARYAARLQPIETDATKRKRAAWQAFCQILFASNEFLYLN